VGLINQAPTRMQQIMGTGPILLTGSICVASTSLRFFLTGNSAGDKKRPIQKEGGLNEKEKN